MSSPKSLRRWRDYQTAAGNRPVREFLDGLREEDRAEVAAAMKDVRHHGLDVAQHLRGGACGGSARGVSDPVRQGRETRASPVGIGSHFEEVPEDAGSNDSSGGAEAFGLAATWEGSGSSKKNLGLQRMTS